MARLTRYGKILARLREQQFQVRDGNKLEFEQFSLCLSDKHHMLALFCLLSLRPANKFLTKELWLFIRQRQENNLPVKSYIFNYAEASYFDIIYTSTFEEKTKKLSKANSKQNNPAFKGQIMAVNLKTKLAIIMTGIHEIRAFGFNPCMVYNCVNDTKSVYTHKGHVFIRITGEDDEEASSI